MCNKRPNYYVYPMQHQPQRAYIEIDAEGCISSDWARGIGSGVPCDVWNKERLWFYIQPELSESEIDNLIEEIKEKYLPRLLEITEIRWDGNNKRRMPISKEFYLEYHEIYCSIDQLCNETYSEDSEPCNDEECEYCNFEG